LSDTPIHPPTMRARLMLDVAAELTTGNPFRHVHVEFSDAETPIVFSSSSTPDGIADVVAGKVTMATINPSSALTIAYRGNGPFGTPQPVRTIAVMPSLDQFVFAMNPQSGITSFADLAAATKPLTIAVRGEDKHSLQFMLDDVLAAAAAPRAQLEARGIRFERRGGVPWPDSPKFAKLAAGEIDGIFDEGAGEWLGAALDAGMTIFGIPEAAVAHLETFGYRRALLEKSRYPQLVEDVLTLDFSGWTIFVRADTPDDLVTKICAALDARKATIAWERPGPLPVERMARNTPDAPYDVPLHPAAERYWSTAGYLA
jgi:TRAP-type uncharacterized transport system substrate-binding protein